MRASVAASVSRRPPVSRYSKPRPRRRRRIVRSSTGVRRSGGGTATVCPAAAASDMFARHSSVPLRHLFCLQAYLPLHRLRRSHGETSAFGSGSHRGRGTAACAGCLCGLRRCCRTLAAMTILSILELARVTEETDARGALDNARDLAAHAEAWGYRRLWVAEPPNMPGIASAATSVVIPHIAAGPQHTPVGTPADRPVGTK